MTDIIIRHLPIYSYLSHYISDFNIINDLIFIAILFILQFILSVQKPKQLGAIIPSAFIIVYMLPGIFDVNFPTCNAYASMTDTLIEFVLPYQIITLLLVIEWFLCRLKYRKTEPIKTFWKNKFLIVILILMIVQAAVPILQVTVYNKDLDEIYSDIYAEEERRIEKSEYIVENYSDSLEKIFRYAKANKENPFNSHPEELKAEIEELEEVLIPTDFNSFDQYAVNPKIIYHTDDESRLFICTDYVRNGAMLYYVGILWDDEIETLSASFNDFTVIDVDYYE